MVLKTEPAVNLTVGDLRLKSVWTGQIASNRIQSGQCE
jgi:hypothetical protein